MSYDLVLKRFYSSNRVWCWWFRHHVRFGEQRSYFRRGLRRNETTPDRHRWVQRLWSDRYLHASTFKVHVYLTVYVYSCRSPLLLCHSLGRVCVVCLQIGLVTYSDVATLEWEINDSQSDTIEDLTTALNALQQSTSTDVNLADALNTVANHLSTGDW